MEETHLESVVSETADKMESAPSVQTPKTNVPFSLRKKIFIGIGVFLLLLLSVGGVLAFKTYTTLKKLQGEVAVAEALGKDTYALLKTQNLPAVQTALNTLDTQLQQITATYSELSFYNSVPFARTYYQDGTHGLTAAAAGLSAARRSVAAVTPYADVLGFSGEGSFTGGTAEERLKLILQTLQKVTPEIDAITADIEHAKNELNQIDANDYPENFKGIALREKIVQAQQVSDGAVTALTEFRPVIEQLPSIAGATGTRKQYLILFQNDNELRPTGGFLTAYAIVNIENGKVFPEKSDDIYELDKKFPTKLPIPAALGRYLTTEKRWNLRDMNISPDFKESMDTFYSHYRTIKGEPQQIDGIIAVDTEFLKKLLTILGPVQIPGGGTFSAENDKRCDCPQIIYALSEIITRPTPYVREDRKGILGPLMREVLTKAYTAPKQQWPGLFSETYTALQGRHIQLYFTDEKAQAAAEVIGAAGRMKPAPENTDFFALVNANLGGAKSNLFITYDAKQVIAAPENGMLQKSVEITYKNSRKGDNCNLEAGLLCLNSTLRDWTRIYVPKGSVLSSSQGFTKEPTVYEENGFTVFDGFFILEPNSTAKLKLTYSVPYTDTKEYRASIWKQGGILDYTTLFDVTGGEEKVDITKDTTYKTAF